MFCISAEHRDGGGVDCGKYKTREPPLILSFFFFFFIKHTKKNEDDKRESEILINNSGIRAINRQYWIFRTLEGWSQLRWRRTGS